MSLLQETLERLSQYLWKPVRFKMEEDYFIPAQIFDFTKVNKDGEYYEVYFEDSFCDGKPDELDFEKKVPFVLLGEPGRDDCAEGELEGITQADEMYFLDIENGVSGKVPVYKIDIDGTAIVRSFEKIADDISEFEFEILHGFEEE